MNSGTEIRYRPLDLNIPADVLRDLQKLNPRHSMFWLALVWIQIVVLLVAYRYSLPSEFFWPFYVPFIFLIAGRMGVLLQLVHEASHSLLSTSKSRNDFIARWLCSLPIGINFDGYVAGHLRHHAYTGTDKEPETDYEKYRVSDFRSPALYALFVKDLLGLTALFVFLGYTKGKGNRGNTANVPERNWTDLIQYFLQLAFTQILVLGLLFQLDIVDYILLWIIPAMSPHMFLMRIRGIAEHGLSKQMDVETTRTDEGLFYTRSMLTEEKSYRFPVLALTERLLIGSLNVNYHHEHHLYPKVPFYNLAKLHRHVADQVARKNSDVYAPGYFAAAMRNILPA